MGERTDQGVGRFELEGLTDRIIACIIRVHRGLGPGFLEKVYRRALVIELMELGLGVEMEKAVVVHYRGRVMGRHWLDIVVDGQVILELKTVESLSRAHYAQARSYLKAANLRLALLVNFAGDRADYRRVELR